LGPLYYAIEIVKEGGCDPGKRDGYYRSRSNIMNTTDVGLDDNPETNIRFYPNPAHDILHIMLNETAHSKNTEVVIFDIQGKPLLFQLIENEKSRISIGGLKPGVYIIQVSYDQTLVIRKLLIY
jgi:hypothetical protein